MITIRNLFETTRSLDRRIEKVISFDNAANDQLKREITEYVVTDSIESSFERLLSFRPGHGRWQRGIGIWVSGFYGSGKSSFTKYLGFALDPTRTVDGKPFLEWLGDQLKTKALGRSCARSPNASLHGRHDRPRQRPDRRRDDGGNLVRALLDGDAVGRLPQGSQARLPPAHAGARRQDGRVRETHHSEGQGQDVAHILNQPLVAARVCAGTACEFYPDVFKTAKAFKDLKVDDVEFENERVKEMLELIRRKSGRENIIFILDEVGQYVARGIT